MNYVRGKILFVEDDEVDQMAISRFARESDFPYDFQFAGSVVEANQALEACSFDAVVLDYQLGDGDAFDLLPIIKGPAIILVTGKGDVDTAVKALKMGACDYLEKDTESNYLKALTITIENSILRKKEEKELEGYRQGLEELVEERTVDLNKAIARYKKSETKLIESEKRFRSLAETTSDWIWEVDENGNYTYASPKIVDILGYGPEEVIGRNPFELMPPDEAERVGEIFGRIVASKKPFSLLENTNIHKEGRYVILETSGVPIINEKGEFGGYRGIDRDVTERKKAERNLEQSYFLQGVVNSILRNALKSIPLEKQLEIALKETMSLSGILLDKGVIYLVNDDDPEVLVMTASHGLNEKQLMTCHKVPFGTCVCGMAALSQKVQTANSESHMHEIKLQGIEPHGHYCVPLVVDGKTIGVLTLYVSIDHQISMEEKEVFETIAQTLANVIEFKNTEVEKVRLQSQLNQAQKIDSVGRLAGGIAHDFNNLLTAINGYAELCLLKIQPNDSLYDDIQVILSAGRKAADLTGQLLAFSRKQIMNPEVLNLNTAIDNSQKILKRIIREDILIELIKEKDLWNILADSTQLNQVIINLVINAGDAMPDGGKLTIETRNIRIENTQTRQHYGIKFPGDYASLIITDTGFGMSKEVREQIFEPFYTTKETGKGTGLGLATVYGIVKQSQGHIHVKTVPGYGSTFSVFFPRIESRVDDLISFKTEAVPLGNETVLLVEDDETVRHLTQRLLMNLGYKVLSAGDGLQALEELTEMNNKIDLLITDVVMPKMSGGELTERVQEIYPSIKTLFISGYAEDSAALKKIIAQDVKLLQKPYTKKELSQAIREVLEK